MGEYIPNFYIPRKSVTIHSEGRAGRCPSAIAIGRIASNGQRILNGLSNGDELLPSGLSSSSWRSRAKIRSRKSSLIGFFAFSGCSVPDR